MTTRQKITEAALSLFAEYGYKGTSVKQIADAVGIKDASLYKHFRSKQEILDSILALVKNHIAEVSRTLGIPNDSDNQATEKMFSNIEISELKHISREMLRLYFTDPYLSKFWRLAHCERYHNEEIYSMFRRIFFEETLFYQTNIFAYLIDKGIFIEANPTVVAMNFYSPVFLLLSMFDGQLDKVDEAVIMLDKQIDEFVRIYSKEKY